jgi:hypothetical protein
MQPFAPDWHCDLMEQLSDYKACASMSLEDVALAITCDGQADITRHPQSSV